MTAPKKVGLIGAGTMGGGIAQKVAQSGIEVILMDIGQKQLEAGLSRIRSMLDQGVQRKVFRAEQRDQILSQITPTVRIQDLADCDLVVEAVFEDLEIKRKLFSQLEQHLRPDAVLASNTSSYKVSTICQGAKHPERFVGLHYFYHPAKNRLLEVIPHTGTSKQTLQRAWSFAEAHGKTAIHSQDAPGFVVNRFFVPWLTESVRLLEEGLADIPTIDQAARELFGIGMGPFQLMNLTGVPIAQHAADGLALELGSFYRAAERLRQQVASKSDWDLSGQPNPDGLQKVQERLLGTVLLVAASLVEEGVASIEDTEIGAKVGLLWPHGPFTLANRHGVKQAVACAQQVAERYDLGLPALIANRSSDPHPFEISLVEKKVEDGIARLTMNRPDALNALDPDTVRALAEAFDAAQADPQVRAIVIEGRGKAFVAGADIKYFIQGIDSGDLDRIVDFTRYGHELFLRIERCPKPVIARLCGLALGGGVELALAADAIVADKTTAMGFPETGIGIYPGLGGTQRLAKRSGLAVARYLVFTGDIIGAKKAHQLGLVDYLTEPGDSMATVTELISNNKIQPGVAKTPKEVADEELGTLFNDANTQLLLAGSFASEDKSAQKIQKKIKSKAPVAMALAHQLMNQALDTPIEKGIELELASLTKVFSTEDARAGLASVGRTKPEFKGR